MSNGWQVWVNSNIESDFVNLQWSLIPSPYGGSLVSISREIWWIHNNLPASALFSSGCPVSSGWPCRQLPSAIVDWWASRHRRSVREVCCESAGSLVHAAPSPGSSPKDSGARVYVNTLCVRWQIIPLGPGRCINNFTSAFFRLNL